MNTGQIERAKDYLEKLENKTVALSFPYQTGNPVVDVLLGEKMELAEVRLGFQLYCQRPAELMILIYV